mmetsp:Transcript_173418/g.421799  ORF Transcript_173418/g.421799 Transcript_173418/m.421799 type:complete len:401 (+) Transcript_173418:2376-3578(+)
MREPGDGHAIRAQLRPRAGAELVEKSGRDLRRSLAVRHRSHNLVDLGRAGGTEAIVAGVEVEAVRGLAWRARGETRSLNGSVDLHHDVLRSIGGDNFDLNCCARGTGRCSRICTVVVEIERERSVVGVENEVLRMKVRRHGVLVEHHVGDLGCGSGTLRLHGDGDEVSSVSDTGIRLVVVGRCRGRRREFVLARLERQRLAPEVVGHGRAAHSDGVDRAQWPGVRQGGAEARGDGAADAVGDVQRVLARLNLDLRRVRIEGQQLILSDRVTVGDHAVHGVEVEPHATLDAGRVRKVQPVAVHLRRGANVDELLLNIVRFEVIVIRRQQVGKVCRVVVDLDVEGLRAVSVGRRLRELDHSHVQLVLDRDVVAFRVPEASGGDGPLVRLEVLETAGRGVDLA